VSAGTPPGKHGPFGAAKSKKELKASLAKLAKDAKETFRSWVKSKRQAFLGALCALARKRLAFFVAINLIANIDNLLSML
jgi:hypothetical protein